MNKHWSRIKLGDVIKLEYGKPLPKEKRKPDGQYSVYGANGEKNRTDEFFYDKKSIIVGRKGSAGEVTLTEEKFWPLDVTYYVTFDDKSHDLFFIYYLLSKLALPKLAKGVKPGINRNEVYGIEVDIPPLSEQQRIVSILDESFYAIAKAKKNDEKNLQNARELFESYLQSVSDNPGDDWEVKKLGEVCNLYQGLAINAKTKHLLVEKSDLPLLRIKDLRNNSVEQYVDPNNYPKNSLVCKEDLIYTRTGQIGLVFTGKNGVLHNNSFKIVPEPLLLNRFLYWLLQSNEFKSKIIKLASRMAQPDITHKIFKDQSIFVPSISEQRQIANALDSFYIEAKKLECIYQQKLARLEELKKSILHKAFNGEL